MNKELRHAFFKSELKTRDTNENGEKYIEGYFAVFNQPAELYPGYYEQVAPGAFDNSLKSNDIRCLFNHDSNIVLGRNLANTLELRKDAHGLWGKVKINENDTEAINAYSRVERGDISGCSFGFYIVDEEYCVKDDGTELCILNECDTYEISVCTFPAYEQTQIQARKKDFESAKKRSIKVKKEILTEKLGGLKC